MRDLTFSEVERLETTELDVPFEMDEEAFRAFYDRTARPLWSYLSRLTSDPQVADDLLQETFYRFLRVRGGWESESHRRAYLFRIATNLVKDGRRRARHGYTVPLPDSEQSSLVASGVNPADAGVRRTDLQRAMEQLRPRERALLWLAYAQGHAHTEIADTLGVKTASVKLLLFRARRKLAGILQPGPARTEGDRR
jgi:RNA polymerase sigma-70 factor (ECF subfamily)